MPSLLPSEEKTVKPISGLTFAGAVADLSPERGAMAGFSAGSAGRVAGPVCGIGARSGLVAAGGDVGDGGGGVWADTDSSGMPARMVAAASRRTGLNVDM